VPYGPVLKIIEDRFNLIKEELKLNIDLDREFKTIRENLDNKCDEDYIVSRGEYLSALLMADYLGCDFVDAKDVIFFNYDCSINKEKTNAKLKDVLSEKSKAIIPGFYGSYLIADPKIVKNPKQIEKITYKELRELSYMGASVLHDEAVFPVRQAGIPINIRNTNEPENPGTLIIEDEQADEDYAKGHIITGIAGKKDFSFFYIHKEHMANEVGIVKKALEVFENRGISIDHIPSGIDSFTIVLPSESVEKVSHEIVEELKDRCRTETVQVYSNLSLITTVGIKMAYQPGISAKLFTALGNKNINIRMIDQGSSEINIIVAVEDKDFEGAIRAIYDAFIK